MVKTTHHLNLYPFIMVKEDSNRPEEIKFGASARGLKMNEPRTLYEDQNESGIYEIRLKGHLDRCWAYWFDNLTITLEDNGQTLLTGPVVDQAELYGLLRKVRDLGMPLLSVALIEPGQEEKTIYRDK